MRRDRRRLRSSFVALALAVSLVFAGCSGFTDGASGIGGSGGGSGDDGPGGNRGDQRVSVTPAPVPTTGPTATPGPRVAPGLATTGVTNASALAAAHEDGLDDAPVTISKTTTYRYGSGEIARRETVTTRIGADGRRLRIVERRTFSTASGTTSGTTGTASGDTAGSTAVREVYWFGTERSARAITYANGTTIYEVVPPGNLTRGRRSIIATEAARIGAVAAGFETRVRRSSEAHGATRYRVTSVGETEGENRTELVGFVPVTGFRMVVDSRGVVREYRLVRRLSVQRRGKPTEIVTHVRYTDVGTTTVERPSWYGAALNASRRSNATDGTGGDG